MSWWLKMWALYSENIYFRSHIKRLALQWAISMLAIIVCICAYFLLPGQAGVIENHLTH